jgi:integrase
MLTDTAIRKAKIKSRRYKLADREGLYLAVLPSGKKVFRYEYRYLRRRETLTLGTYSDTGAGMTLVQARKAHAEARGMLERNQSPAVAKQRERAVAASQLANTFKSVATAWLDELAPHRSGIWLRLVKRWFENDVFPVIGTKPLAEIDRTDVLAACQPARDRGRDHTAEATRRYIAMLFSWAESRGITDRNPARAARGAITVPPTRELPAMRAKEVRELIRAIREAGGRPSTRVAFELLLYTFTRKSELLRATWDELDFEAAEWRIPAARMKMREAHIVPLSVQAIALFQRQKQLASGSKFVFPSVSTLAKPLSDTALNNALRRLGYEQFSPHSFRRTASTMLNELGFRSDFIERQLAHSERSKVRAAYNKATYLPERRQMMQSWADHVDAIIAGAKVVPMKARA